MTEKYLETFWTVLEMAMIALGIYGVITQRYDIAAVLFSATTLKRVEDLHRKK